MYLKRQSAPKTWPIPRKGNVYVVRPSSGLRKGIPLLLILREYMGIVQNKKEAKKAIFLKKVFINWKIPKNERAVLLLFDILTNKDSNESYRIVIGKNGKFEVEKIRGKEAEKKIAKIIGKKIIKKGKIQLNLSDGRNFVSDIKCSINDSLVINLKEGKIEKCIPLEKGKKAFVFEGKHIGETGEITKIDKNKKMIAMKDEKAESNVLIKQIIVLE